MWLVLASVGDATSSPSPRHAAASLVPSIPADSSPPPPPGWVLDQSAPHGYSGFGGGTDGYGGGGSAGVGYEGETGWPGYPFVPVPYIPPPVPGSLCDDVVIPNSNRTAEFPCKDYFGPWPYQGTECFFKCNPGFIALGRHVCQWHDPDWVRHNDKHYPQEDDPKFHKPDWATNKQVKELEEVPPPQNHHFWGGTCAPLCGDNPATQSCPAGQSHRRYKESTLTQSISDGNDCMETECFPTKEDNLKNVARGIYEVMKIARDMKTGIYYNSVNFDFFKKYMERANADGEYAVKHGSGSNNRTKFVRCGSGEWLREASQAYQIEVGKNFSLDATAFGIMSEVVGTALGYQTPQEGADNVRDTIGNLTRQTKGRDMYDANGEFEFARDSRGFFSHFYVHRKMNTTSTMATSVLVQAALFARSYFSALAAGQRHKDVLRAKGSEIRIEPSAQAVFESSVSRLGAIVMTLYDSVDFTSVLCDESTGFISPEGTGIAFTIGMDTSHPCGCRHNSSRDCAASLCNNAAFPNKCGKATSYVGSDGMYNFSEIHNVAYLAYQQACGSQEPGECDNEPIELMWNRWQKRRHSPNHHYEDSPILSTQGGYMLQVLWYTTSSFSNDTKYQELFYNHWLADQLFYRQALHAGKRGRYGLGEGPEAKWCEEQTRYNPSPD